MQRAPLPPISTNSPTLGSQIATCLCPCRKQRPFNIVILSQTNELIRFETYRTAELANQAFFELRESFDHHSEMYALHLRYRNQTWATIEKVRPLTARQQRKERAEREYEHEMHRQSRWMVANPPESPSEIEGAEG